MYDLVIYLIFYAQYQKSIESTYPIQKKAKADALIHAVR